MLPVAASGQLMVVIPFTTSTRNGRATGDGETDCVAAVAADFSIDRRACGSAEEMPVVTTAFS